MDELFGVVEKISFKSEETGFTVASLLAPRSKEPISIVGTLSDLQPGEQVRCRGTYRHHPAHGLQFQVMEYTASQPTDLLGIQRYLESGMVRGIGKRLAARILDTFGTKSLEILDSKPELLLKVEGIGEKKLDQIRTSWKDQQSIRKVMVFLQGHGVSPGYAQKIFKHYGEEAISLVTANPYRLARDVHGIGFRMADQIADKLGMHRGAPERLRAGLEYTLEQLATEGHTCVPKDALLETAERLLGLPQNQLLEALSELIREERILSRRLHGDQEYIWLRIYWMCEQSIVREVDRLLQAPLQVRIPDLHKALEWSQKALNIEFAPGQGEAIQSGISKKMLVITGGPGTGKSTLTRAILSITQKLTSKILLATPTGRAAKRLGEITGSSVSTLHSLLEMDFAHGGFKKGRDDPLECDVLIVDESSMIDTYLMSCLLKAIPSRARVIFVGDVDQLPSVGAGTVLKDLIQSEMIPMIRLTEIFRQASGSRIITNAHAIHKGECPDIKWDPHSDFFFYPAESPEAVLQTMVRVVTQELPRRRGLDPMQDIQILAPMKKGLIGTENLNVVFQQVLNPAQVEPLMRMGRRFLPGDKVMQIRNNYDKNVFNGDVGRIETIEPQEGLLKVQFDDRLVEYDLADADELVLAYAVSVHKYQGSEIPCVVMPIHTSHFKMLQRNLLYTGVTRGKRCVVLVGTLKALHIAVQQTGADARWTGLCEALRGVESSFSCPPSS